MVEFSLCRKSDNEEAIEAPIAKIASLLSHLYLYVLSEALPNTFFRICNRPVYFERREKKQKAAVT